MVDRCVCAGITFEDLLRVQREQEFACLEALKEWTGCCLGCGTCEPYVRLCLKTGRTVFAVLTVDEAEAALR